MVRSIYLYCLRGAVVLATVGLALVAAVGIVTPSEQVLAYALCGTVLISALRLLRYARTGADERVRKSQMMLGDAEQLARFGSWEWDIRSNNVTWSANLARIYGINGEAANATYETFLDYVHAKDRARVKDEIERACKNRSTFECYYRINAADGAERILYARGKAVHEPGQPVRLVATAQDVSEWKRAEESLGRAHAESEAKVLARTAELTLVNERLRREITQRRRAEESVHARARQQSAAAQFGVQALEENDLPHLMREAATLVAQTLEVDYCEILDLLARGPMADRPAGAGWMELSSALSEEEPVDDLRGLGFGTTVAASACDDPTVPPRPHDCEVASGVSISIESARRRYGALAAYCRRQRAFSDDDVHFLQSIANILATAIERSRAHAVRNRLAALIEATPDLVGTAHPNLNLCDLNPAGRKMLGIKPDEDLSGRTMLDFYPHWARRLILNEGLPSAVRDGVWSGEAAVLGADGREIPVYQVIIAQLNANSDLEFIGSIVRDLSERKNLEREIISATEREQQRIGQDLHDDLCQHLTGVAFRAKALEQRLAEDRPRDAMVAIEIQDLLDQAIVRARDLAHGLQPVKMEVGGLGCALEELSLNTHRVFGVACVFEGHVGTAVCDRVVATHLYRIAQEATRNAIVHGKAQNICVRLESDQERATLTIEDDGVGMRAGALSGKGLGLQIMNHRARIISGTLTIQRREANGTRIMCTVRNGAVGNATRGAAGSVSALSDAIRSIGGDGDRTAAGEDGTLLVAGGHR